MSAPEEVTARVAAHAAAATARELPAAVLHEAARCLLNFVGCAIGGGSHDVAPMIERALLPLSGPPTASLIGRRRRADPLLAALFNGTCASAHSFDDTHAEAVVHPGAPVGAATLALAQARGASGADTLLALALGVEVTCRLSKAISVEPAVGDIAWYQTGVTGGVGAAIAAGKLLGLDAAGMSAAIGIAVAQASGTRAMQGSMTMLMLAGHAAQTGVRAALLAEQGFESPPASLEAPHGFARVYAPQPHLEALTAGLGERWEILSNNYKAYPCGVVLHPVVDACFELRADPRFAAAEIAAIAVRVAPMALKLTDRPQPVARTEGQVSLQHWAATALAFGRAGLAEGTAEALRAPGIAALRARVQAAPQPGFARDAAQVVVRLESGVVLESGIHRGCVRLSDAALEAKFRAQAEGIFTADQTGQLLGALWRLGDAESIEAVGRLLES